MSKSEMNDGQTEISRKKNAQFFLEEHADYKKKIEGIDSYKAMSLALNQQLYGMNKVLDIGNGGVFDYDTKLVSEIVGLDLFLDDLPKELVLPTNVQMVQGSALDIPNQLIGFDAVLMVMLIHHLVGETVSICEANVRKSFSEAYKVISPGGKLIVMDSCVPFWFYIFEKTVFRLAAWLISRLIKHPPVLQYTSDAVIQMMSESGFSRIESIVIPKGRYILQFGIKFPAWLTPTQPTLFIGHKD